ncbi:hypothetical protein HN873_008244, partial [Arachis hypogaea]
PRLFSIPFNVVVLKSPLLNPFLLPGDFLFFFFSMFFLNYSYFTFMIRGVVNRFVPPENFDLALLTFELEFIKKGAKNEQIDVPQLSKQLWKRFTNQ